MGDTLNEFVKFIIGDPIMLGLCITIVVLIILFIIVLLMGKRQDRPEVESAEKETEIFKTEIDMSPVMESVSDSVSAPTTEPNILPIDSYDQGDSMGTVDSSKDAVEIPVSIEEPVALEIPLVEENPMENIMTEEKSIESSENYYKDFPSFEDIKIQPNIMEEQRGFADSVPMDFASEETPRVDVGAPTASELSDVQIIESSVNPLEGEETNIFDVDFDEKTGVSMESSNDVHESHAFEPLYEEPNVEEKANPYDSEAVSDFIELPSLKVQDFSKTSIIRNMPVMETSTNTSFDISDTEKVDTPMEDDEDDLALPKFNTNSSSPFVDAIKGESFNID